MNTQSQSHTCRCVLARSIRRTGCWGTGCLGLWWSHRPLVCFECDLKSNESRWERKYPPRDFFPLKSNHLVQTCLKPLYYSPITSSFTSFHSISFPVSWAMVTVILLWMPCGVERVVGEKTFFVFANEDKKKKNYIKLQHRHIWKHDLSDLV